MSGNSGNGLVMATTGRTRRGTAALTAVLLAMAGVGVVLAAPPVEAAGSFQVTARAPSPVLVGTPVEVLGAVSPGTTGKPVKLQRYRSGSWRTVRETRLDAASRYRFSLGARATGTWKLRVVKPGGTVDGRRVRRGVSKTRTVRIVDETFAVGIRASRSQIFDGAEVTFAGGVSPAAPGSVVHLQTEAESGWRTVASTALGKRSGYRFTRSFASAPEVARFRVLKPASATVYRGTSSVVELRHRTWSTVTAGNDFSCGLTSDSAAWCWGWDTRGQLGDGSESGVFTGAQHVVGADDWVVLDAGVMNVCGIRRDASAWCWGDNRQGQVGDGSSGPEPVVAPVQVLAAGSWRSVTAGYQHACGLDEDGTAWCWGLNDRGQLGTGAVGGSAASPVPVDGDAIWTSIDAGSRSTCGVQQDGTAWCWGSDSAGELGDGANDYGSASAASAVPVQVEGDHVWADVVAGSTSCGVATDGIGRCWGSNANDKLGRPGDSSSAPVEVAGSWTGMTVGAGHVCGLAKDDSAWCWGSRSSGQVGDGMTGPLVTNGPKQVAAEALWSALSAGYDHTCATRPEGSAWCWGDNQNGALGTGDLENRSVPTRLRVP